MPETTKLAPTSSSSYWESALKPLFQIIRFDRTEIVYIALYGFAVGLLSLAVPLGTQTIVNATAFIGLPTPVLVLTLIVLGVLLLGAFIRLLQTALDELIQQKIFARVSFAAVDSLKKTAHLSTSNDPREIATRFFDIMTLQKSLSILLLDALTVVLLSIFAILILGFYHPFLVIFSITVFGALFVLLRLTMRKGMESNNETSTEKYNVGQWISLVARDRNLFHHPLASEFLRTQTDEHVRRYLVRRQEHFRNFFKQNAGLFLLQAISSSALLGLGGWLVIKGQLNLGQLVTAEILLSYVVGYVARLGKYIDAFYDVTTAAKKISYLISEEPEEDDGFVSIVPWEKSPSIKWRLSHLKEMKITRGQVVRVTGATKSQVSEFLRANWGCTPEQSSSIELSEVQISKFFKSTLRTAVLYIDKASVFSGSPMDNLRILAHDWTTEHIESRYLQLPWLDRINDMRNLNASFSRADRALITVARMFFCSSHVILVDDVFDSLNTADQLNVLKSFKNLNKDQILIINSDHASLPPELVDVHLDLKTAGSLVSNVEVTDGH